MIRTTIIILLLLSCLPGCTSGETWAAVEAERRRIATELKRIVPAEQQDVMQTIVFDRPRAKSDSIVTGYEHAIARVNRERLDFAEAEEEYRSLCLAIQEKRIKPLERAEESAVSLKRNLDIRRPQILEAQRFVLIAEAVNTHDDWMPVADLLVDDVLSSTNKPSRTLPDSEQLRLRRAREWFTAWRAKYQAVQP